MSTADHKQHLRVHIRWMIRRDMPEVLDIERDSFEFPWSEEDFMRCLRQRNCIGMVAERGDRVIVEMMDGEMATVSRAPDELQDR